MPKKITTDNKKITKMYNKGLSIDSIAKSLCLSPSTVGRRLKDCDILTRSPRVYQLNENYFDTINNENKAYWLGFISADGNVNKTSNTIMVALKMQDINHLSKLLKDLSSNYKLYDMSGKCAVSFTSQQMKSTLRRYGVVPNKSFSIRPPKIRKDLERHYWRGVIDGDGCIYKRKIKNRKVWGVSLTGNIYMTSGFYKFIADNLNYPLRQPIKDRSSYKACFEGSARPISVIKLLYKNPAIYLDRKYVLACEAISDTPRYGSRS